jgi:hypothetical protein
LQREREKRENCRVSSSHARSVSQQKNIRANNRSREKMYPTLPDRYTEQHNQQHHPQAHHHHHHHQQQQQQQQFFHSQGAFSSNQGGGRAQKPNEVTGAPDGNQRYKATLFPLSDEHDVQSAIVQVGIDGVVIFNETQTEEVLNSPMNKISSWQQIDDSMFRIVCDDNKKVPSREIVITADNATTGAIIDSLLSGAFQWCELNSYEGSSTIVCDDSNEWTNLSSDFNVAKRRREISTEYNNATATTTVGSSAMSSGAGIAYWEKPYEHSGWLWKKGETVRMWRRRFFILKSNHIFWFKSADVTAKTPPRGTIPLSRVDSVSPAAARDAGKSHSLTLEGAFCERIGARHLAADSDQERDGWISALRTSSVASEAQNRQPTTVAVKSPPPATTSALGNKLKSAYETSSSPSNPPPQSYRQQPTTSTSSPISVRSPTTISVSTYSSGQPQSQPELPPLPFQHPGVATSHSRNHVVRTPQNPQQVYYTPQGRAYIVDPLTGQSKWC